MPDDDEEKRVFITGKVIESKSYSFNRKTTGKEILDKINRNESIEEEGEHIGIQNVKERIREFYGEAYELKITSQPGYSEIRILLPRIEKQ